MTKFPFSVAWLASRRTQTLSLFALSRCCWFGIVCLLALAGCSATSGQQAASIAEPQIASAYLPLSRQAFLGLDRYAGAAMVVAPGIAATNGHNRNLVPQSLVIGEARDYDLLFFRTTGGVPAATAAPAIGAPITAYGQGPSNDLRLAHGVVRQIVTCPGCSLSAYFIYSNDTKSADDAGPGFSGGPVVDGAGRLVGITFGYKDEGGRRSIYAYDMARVLRELQTFVPAQR